MTDSFDVYLTALRGDDLPAKIGACDALLQADAVPLLIDTLHDADADVRWRVLVVLGWIGAVQSIPHMINALTDDEWAVRHSALWSLGMLRHESVVEPLLHTLHAPDSEEQVRYVTAMGLVNQEREDVDTLLRADRQDVNEKVSRPSNAALINPQFWEGRKTEI